MKGHLKDRHFGCKTCKLFYRSSVFGEREKSSLVIFSCTMKGISDKFLKFSAKKAEPEHFPSKGLRDIHASVAPHKICYIRYVI